MAKGKKVVEPVEPPADVSQVVMSIALLIQCGPAILLLLHLFPALVDDHVTLFISGLALLSVSFYLFYYVLVKTMKLTSMLGLVFVAITFTAYIDTFLALCLLSKDFFLGRFYLDKGERYFNSTYGFICLFWDGTFHVVIQFAIAVMALTHRNYHFTALVWAGSVINSMQPLLLGAATGPYSGEIQLATALNVPYIFLPVGVIVYLLSRTPPIHRKEGAGSRVKSHHLLTDVVLMAYNFILPCVHIVRCMCVLGSHAKLVDYWVKVEPTFDRKLLVDTNDKQDFAFMNVQVLQWGFWFVPWHWAALFEQIERIRTGKRSVLLGDIGVDLSALMLGGYLQSMACFLTTSYFDMHEGVTGLNVRKASLPLEFWLVNISTLVCALLHFVHFHVQDIEDAKQD